MTSKLQDYIKFKNGKKRPKEVGMYPVFGGNGILEYTNEYNAENCIIIGRVGAYCGCVYKYNKKCWISDNAICGINNENANLGYFYYLLSSLQLNKRSIGSGQPLMTQDILNNIEVDVPPLETQQKIAKVLSAIDDKIELNNKINENLEQIAIALYNHYFPYTKNDILPKNWRIGTVGEIIKLHDSKRIPLSGKDREQMKNRIYPYYGATSLIDYVDNYIFDGIYLLLGEDGTVVDNLGKPILQYVWGKFWVNNHAHILTGKRGFNVESLYLLFKQLHIKTIVTGAVQAKISQANLKSLNIVIPPENLISKFNLKISELFEQIRNNSDENTQLTQLRDTLLPKLMSGEIDVSNVEIDGIY